MLLKDACASNRQAIADVVTNTRQMLWREVERAVKSVAVAGIQTYIQTYIHCTGMYTKLGGNSPRQDPRVNDRIDVCLRTGNILYIYIYVACWHGV